MTDAYNKIQDRLFDGIAVSQYGMIDVDSAREWAEREILQLYEALEELKNPVVELVTDDKHGPWQVTDLGGHYVHRIEYDLAERILKGLDAANAVMAKARGESPGPHGPEGS